MGRKGWPTTPSPISANAHAQIDISARVTALIGVRNGRQGQI
jgi:hypothetical protein